ncbi:hypothetical protein Tco_1085363 [Tanacetum coccineum]
MRHQEIPKFCDATLKRVLEGLKSYNNDVKHGYATSSLSKEDVEYMQLFKEEIEERLKHRDQIRRWEKVKEEKKGKEERRCFKCGDLNNFISDCPKHSFNDQKAFIGGCWSDSEKEDDSKKDEIRLMAVNNNERGKNGKIGQESGKTPIVEPAKPVHSAREPASSNEGNWPPAEVPLKTKLESDEWIKDSGCSGHMTSNKDLVSTY